ncbi:MAG: hypothetical protein K8F91_14215 [Candidatus Obscuribacterales bacterium]|nr:hypothetical protein [Candidatus Obscuribacterales bacterium]
MANEVNDGSDKVERFDQGGRTSENTSRDSVIGGDRQDHQEIHQEMKDSGRTFQGMNQIYKQQETLNQVDDGAGDPNDESVTIVALNSDGSEVKASGKTGLNENDLVSKPHTQEFFETKAQGAMNAIQNLDQQPRYEPDQLIAANVTPKVPNIETARKFQDVRSDASGTGSDAIAWDGGEMVDSLKAPIVLLPDYLIRDLVRHFGNTQKAIDSLPNHPFRGQEVEGFNQTTKEDLKSWSKAQSKFPELKNVSPDVLKAYTLNELHFYDKLDLSEDVLAAGSSDSNIKKAVDDKTLGMSQITHKGLRDMSEYFPQLKELLKEKGYEGNEAKALLDPSCISVIVAAKTALIVRDLNRNHIPVNTDTIAYSYNADVYSYSDGHGGREYKCLQNVLEVNSSKLQHWDQRKEYYANDQKVVDESKHLRNVKGWLKTPTNAK